ncbi:gamma-secretase activating protein pigeon isoform X2 [Megachile rotundata]|nr:PREDICTED: protein pigeon isoform X3 [Megachile rotundata]
MLENLAVKLCLLLPEKAHSAEQWKLLGQERDGSLLVGWTEEIIEDGVSTSYTVIGHYDRINDKLQVLHQFSEVLNIVQATINQSKTVLGYVIKQKVSTDNNVESEEEKDQSMSTEIEMYEAYIIELKGKEVKIHNLDAKRSKQVRIQFLYKEKEHGKWDKFLLLIHQECIIIYTILFDTSTTDFQTIQELKSESLVKEFIWAQWDMINQVLYHIHHRRIPVSLVSEDEDTKENKSVRTNPTLSGLQFHTELPHETVLNIPLNLPQLSTSSKCGTYEDDVIPLRVHDCSLDLIVISDSKGMVCVCHHYLYRPVKPQQHVLNSLSESNTVHFAYSVTLLHHSCVIHCVIPGIPWSQAKLIRPTFAIYGHHYIIVLVQGLFTHLLEIGTNHEPCCHILCGPLTVLPSYSSYLVPLLELENNNKGGKKKYDSTSVEGNNTSNFNVNILTIDLPTLDLVQLTISPDFLTEVFRKETSIEVRLGILHYFLCHRNDLDIISELVCTIAEKPRSLEIVRYMQEILIGGSYALVQKNLLADAVPLLALLPVTTMEEYTSFEIKVNDLNITLSHEKLWNTSVMLLSPQQRLIPYRSDLWTKLWDQLSKNNGDKARFKPSKIAEKLLVSLACYQPEALSRSSTPMSPSGGLVVATVSLGDLTSSRNSKLLDSGLPFNETESCTASKQEHIVSVNLRELSMYLLKHGTPTSITHVQGSCTPLHVHAMATRYVAAQLETSRILCQMLCRAASVEPRMEQERGFILVDQLDEIRRWLLFVLLERYRRAIESIAFPAPQGFTSFFTYLGYRTLKYSMFLQY